MVATTQAEQVPITLLEPNWIAHGIEATAVLSNDDIHGAAQPSANRAPIYALDICPKNERLLTAGNDNTLRLWSMAAVLAGYSNPMAMEDTDAPTRLLFVAKSHEGGVMCARWSSGTGSLIASVSDDGSILIWRHDCTPIKMSAFSSGTGQAAHFPERLTVVRRLSKMTCDVIDVAWSHDNRFLAAASLDNCVDVFDGQTFDRVATCKHASFVKGVAFDPVGAYLVSQSDDGTAVLWSTSTWKRDKKLTHPFLRDSGSAAVLVRRPSFSPCGSWLACANAVSNGLHVAAVIPRGRWGFSQSTYNLVGHSAPVCVAKFAPIMVPDPRATSASVPPVPLLALGANDRKISIWILGLQPVLVLDAAFDSDITDLAWSSDARVLLASSREGRVVGVHVPANLQVYGGPAVDRPVIDKILLSHGQKPTGVLDHANVTEASSQSAVAGHALPPPPRVTAASSTTRDGRRRIQPQLIATVVPVLPSTPRVPSAMAAASSANASSALSPVTAKQAARPPTTATTTLASVSARRQILSPGPPPPPRRGVRASTRLSASSARPAALDRHPRSSSASSSSAATHLSRLNNGWPLAAMAVSGSSRIAHESATLRAEFLLDRRVSTVSVEVVESGRPLLPAVALDSPPHAVHVGSAHVAVVTAAGTLMVFDSWTRQFTVTTSLQPWLPNDGPVGDGDRTAAVHFVPDPDAPTAGMPDLEIAGVGLVRWDTLLGVFLLVDAGGGGDLTADEEDDDENSG